MFGKLLYNFPEKFIYGVLKWKLFLFQELQKSNSNIGMFWYSIAGYLKKVFSDANLATYLALEN